MAEETIVIKTLDNEVEAGLAQQLLRNAGVRVFAFKDDAGGMEPHLQLTGNVRLVVSRADADRAHKILDAVQPDFTRPSG